MNPFKMAAMVALFAVGAAQAQTSQTNLVQNLSIQLSAVEQAGPVAVPLSDRIWEQRPGNPFPPLISVAVTVDTRQIIQSLGAATTNTFSSGSKLFFITPMDGSTPFIQVRDGSATVDVTKFFSLQTMSEVIRNSSIRQNSTRVTETDSSIRQLALRNSSGYPALAVQFVVSGFATVTSTSPDGIAFQPRDTFINASGTGTNSGQYLVLHGFIRLFGTRLEVVTTGG